MQNQNDDNNNNKAVVDGDYVGKKLKGRFEVTSRGSECYTSSESRLIFKDYDRWWWDETTTSKVEKVSKKLQKALKRSKFEEFRELASDLNAMEKLSLGSRFDNNWLDLCRSKEQYQFVIEFFSTESSIYLNHDNEVLEGVLRDSELSHADRISIAGDLMAVLEIPVILDSSLMDILDNFCDEVDEVEKNEKNKKKDSLSYNLKGKARELKEEILTMGDKYKFAHKLLTAYAFDDKEMFKRLVESQKDGLSYLPPRFPRFISTAILFGGVDCVDFMLKFEMPSVTDFFQVFVVYGRESPFCPQLLEAYKEFRGEMGEEDSKIDMILGNCPKDPVKWNALKVEVFKDIAWRTEVHVKATLQVGMFDAIDPLDDEEY